MIPLLSQDYFTSALPDAAVCALALMFVRDASFFTASAVAFTRAVALPAVSLVPAFTLFISFSASVVVDGFTLSFEEFEIEASPLNPAFNDSELLFEAVLFPLFKDAPVLADSFTDKPVFCAPDAVDPAFAEAFVIPLLAADVVFAVVVLTEVSVACSALFIPPVLTEVAVLREVDDTALSLSWAEAVFPKIAAIENIQILIVIFFIECSF